MKWNPAWVLPCPYHYKKAQEMRKTEKTVRDKTLASKEFGPIVSAGFRAACRSKFSQEDETTPKGLQTDKR